MSVDVICVRNPGEKYSEVFNGVRIHRIKVSRKRAGMLQYMWEYGYFLLAAALKLSLLSLKGRFAVVHVHNMPDVLVFSALLPKIAGSKVILDLHDPMPELFGAKFGKSQANPAIRVLKYLEKTSIRLADLVITPNESFRKLFISRSCPPSKIYIIMNSPDEEIYAMKAVNTPLSGTVNPEGFTILYSGYIAEHNGLDVAIKAVARVRDQIPDVILNVYGDGNFREFCQMLCKDLHLNGAVKFHGYVSPETIATAIQASQVGVIPNKANPFTDLNFPTRIFEFLIQEKPVIVPKTQGIKDYFNEDEIPFFDPGNPVSLSEKLLEIHSDPEGAQKMVRKGISVYDKFRWASQQVFLVKLVRTLVDNSNHGYQLTYDAERAEVTTNYV